MARLSNFSWLILHILSLSSAKTWTDSISAQGLLGSHFGVLGLNATFDYLIVGGGTAGLTLAQRLTEGSDCTVAVIEAGHFYQTINGNRSEVPAYTSYFTGSQPTQKNPVLDWNVYTQPQAALDGRTVLYDSGRVLGGSSGINFLWYNRGTKGAHQKWADEVGDSSYKLNNVLPFYKKSVTFHPPDNSKRPANASARYDPSAYAPSGEGGPLNLAYSNWVNPISAWLGKALTARGLKEISGLSSGELIGWSYLPFELNPETQTRDSSETSFLQQALFSTTNLQIYTSTIARRVLFDEQKRAQAVMVESGGLQYKLTASKEVIISAGSFRSPQLLMASGIGPASTLQSLNIPVIHESPGVGQNMQDNVVVSTSYGVTVTTHSSLANSTLAAAAVEEYNTNRQGILTNVGGDVAGFQRIPDSELSNETAQALHAYYPDDWPYLEYLVLDAYFGDGLDTGTPVPSFDFGNITNFVGGSVGLIVSFSRGNVTIASTDTNVNPVISPNWLLDPRDQELAILAFKYSRKLFATDAIAPIVAGEVYPGTNVTSDDDILRVIRKSASSGDHACCTNKMGRAKDKTAVIDSQARVYGVSGLRVVDASALPFLPPGHPSATVYMLAEKIAADILQGLGQNTTATDQR